MHLFRNKDSFFNYYMYNVIITNDIQGMIPYY